MSNAQRINQTSGDVEYYTPGNIIMAARLTMGTITLDPASSAIANRHVEAHNYYSESDNGLDRQWWGSVWLNHPFRRGENEKWIQKLIKSYERNDIDQACCLTYAVTSERWFGPLHNYPQCYLIPRTNFLLPDGTVKKGVTKGSVVTYLGTDTERFNRFFSGLGSIKVPA